MHAYLIDMLECPGCHGSLSWSVSSRQDERIEEADVRCADCDAAYQVREGIAVFLTPDVPRHDLWADAESSLTRFLRENPALERKLLESPLAELNPADQFFRAMALEERGDFIQARQASDLARERMYTAGYVACHDREVAHLLGILRGRDGPIVDLASGRCILVERLARELPHDIVATDFSVTVLRHDRRRLETLGLAGHLSFLACDARLLPFKDRSVSTMTSNLGLGNVEEAGGLLAELRRCVSGSLLAITYFFPPDDDENAAAIRQLGLSDLAFRDEAVERFEAAGWQVETTNVCRGRAGPTPRGRVIEDAGIDGLPVRPTELEWSLLAAR